MDTSINEMTIENKIRTFVSTRETDLRMINRFRKWLQPDAGRLLSVSVENESIVNRNILLRAKLDHLLSDNTTENCCNRVELCISITAHLLNCTIGHQKLQICNQILILKKQVSKFRIKCQPLCPLTAFWLDQSDPWHQLYMALRWSLDNGSFPWKSVRKLATAPTKPTEKHLALDAHHRFHSNDHFRQA